MSPLAQILAVANQRAPQPVPTQVQPTNVAGIYANYDQQNMDKYKADLGQQNAMYGGLASLGSAGISALPKLLPMLGSIGAGADISGATMAGLTDALGTAAIL